MSQRLEVLVQRMLLLHIARQEAARRLTSSILLLQFVLTRPLG